MSSLSNWGIFFFNDSDFQRPLAFVSWRQADGSLKRGSDLLSSLHFKGFNTSKVGILLVIAGGMWWTINQSMARYDKWPGQIEWFTNSELGNLHLIHLLCKSQASCWQNVAFPGLPSMLLKLHDVVNMAEFVRIDRHKRMLKIDENSRKITFRFATTIACSLETTGRWWRSSFWKPSNATTTCSDEKELGLYLNQNFYQLKPKRFLWCPVLVSCAFHLHDKALGPVGPGYVPPVLVLPARVRVTRTDAAWRSWDCLVQICNFHSMTLPGWN